MIKRRDYILFAFFSISLFLVIVLHRNRRDGLEFSYKSYMTIYYPLELPVISDVNIENDHIAFHISPDKLVQSWEITYDDGSKKGSASSDIKFKLQEGRHVYLAKPKEPTSSAKSSMRTPLKFEINFVGKKLYEESGNIKHNVYDLIHTDIPFCNFKRYPLSLFTLLPYPENELSSTRKILKEEAGISENDNDIDTVRKIFTYLSPRLEKAGGIPSKDAKHLSPYQLYVKAMAGEEKLWCENFAEIYNYFLKCAGIPSRKIGVGGAFKNISLSGHAFVECFSREEGKWFLSDITICMIYVENPEGSLINSIDIFNGLNVGSKFPDLKSATLRNGKITECSFNDFIDSYKYYFRRDSTITFKLPQSGISKYAYICNPDWAYSLKGGSSKRLLMHSMLLILGTSSLFIVMRLFFISVKLLKNDRRAVTAV